jgi:hypothetical protein
MRSYWINDVIELDAGYLAVGWNRIGCCDGGRAATWTSADGTSWTYHDPVGTPFGETYHGPSHLVRLANGDVLLLSWVGLGEGSMLWTSPDGRSWTEVPTDWDGQSFSAFASSPNLVLAIGTSMEAEKIAALASTDGRSWAPAAVPPGAKAVYGLAFDQIGGRFVAGGTDTSDRPMVWTSVDGHNWATTRLSDEQGVVGEVSALDGLLAVSGHLGLDDGKAIVWASHDGVTWSINELGPGWGGRVSVGPQRVVIWVESPDPNTVTQVVPWLGTLR